MISRGQFSPLDPDNFAEMMDQVRKIGVAVGRSL